MSTNQPTIRTLSALIERLRAEVETIRAELEKLHTEWRTTTEHAKMLRIEQQEDRLLGQMIGFNQACTIILTAKFTLEDAEVGFLTTEE